MRSESEQVDTILDYNYASIAFDDLRSTFISSTPIDSSNLADMSHLEKTDRCGTDPASADGGRGGK